MALKWYTRARKFPQLIGRTPDGTRIPGGPYTYTQVAAGVVTAVVLAQTTWLWAHGGLILNATIFIGATVGAVFAAGKLTPGMRNPIVLASGALNLMSSGYRLDGTAIRNTEAQHCDRSRARDRLHPRPNTRETHHCTPSPNRSPCPHRSPSYLPLSLDRCRVRR
jgi:hypothetical protein